DTIERSRRFYGIREDKDLVGALFCDHPDIGQRDEPAIADPIILGAADHHVIDPFELRELVGNIQIEDAVDVAGAAPRQHAGIHLLFIDDIADGKVVGGTAAHRLVVAFALIVGAADGLGLAGAFGFPGTIVALRRGKQVVLIYFGDHDLDAGHIDDLYLNVLCAFPR